MINSRGIPFGFIMSIYASNSGEKDFGKVPVLLEKLVTQVGLFWCKSYPYSHKSLRFGGLDTIQKIVFFI